MRSDERLHVECLVSRKCASEFPARKDIKRCLSTRILCVDMGTMMLSVLFGFHPNEDAIYHCQRCHCSRSNCLSCPSQGFTRTFYHNHSPP